MAAKAQEVVKNETLIRFWRPAVFAACFHSLAMHINGNKPGKHSRWFVVDEDITAIIEKQKPGIELRHGMAKFL